MITFYGEAQLKESLLKYTKQHQEADAYIRGSWLYDELAKNGSKKGCFYGCMTQSKDNTLGKASEQYGLPLWYVHVTEKIYEGLPEEEWLEFPFEAIDILPVGIDMNIVRSKFNSELLKDQLRFVRKDSEQEEAILKCIDLYNVPFNEINSSAAKSAAKSAESAAESVTWSAARLAAKSAESAAWSAKSAESVTWSAEKTAKSVAQSTESAAWSAESVTWSAESVTWSADSAAWSAAQSVYYSFLRDILFKCIKEEVKKTKDINIKTKVL